MRAKQGCLRRAQLPFSRCYPVSAALARVMDATSRRWEKLRKQLPVLAGECLPGDPDDEIGSGLAIDETAHLKEEGH